MLLKCPYYPKQSTDSMKSLIKVTTAFFAELKQSILKCTLEHERLWKPKQFKRGTKPEVSYTLISNCYKAIGIKTVWLWHKKRHIEQWRIESPERKPLLHGQLMYNHSQEWVNLIQKTIISTTMGKNRLEEMEYPS